MRTASNLLVVLLIATFACSGCSLGKGDRWKFASWDVRRAVGLKSDKPDPEIPARLVTTWTETVLNRAGETPKRGFGGRIAFFKNGSQDPVRVDGQFVVYAFDESDVDPYKTEPTRRYIFPAEQFAVYESESALGPSYSIWLPWDEAGGVERKVSLIARFEPKDGAIIVGEQTRHLLSGTLPTESVPGQQLVLAPTPATVNAASYQAPAQPPVGERSVLQAPDPLATTSIPLPRKLSATPGAPLTAQRPAPAQYFTTPHMAGAIHHGSGASGLTPTAGNAATTPQVEPMQQSFAQAYATQAVWQSPVANSPVPTAGYLPAPGPPQAAPRSTGFQLVPPPALATPAGR